MPSDGGEVFVSYSRHDADFVRRFHGALAERGRAAWVDWSGIPPTADWMKEIKSSIEATAAFVFVISPDSVTSDVCREEIEHADERNKRILPIVCRDVPAEQVPDAARRRNWIFFRGEDDFDGALESLLDALDTDPEWAHMHTRLLVRAIEWDASGRDRSFLLRGRDLKAAEDWLAQVDERKDPQPTRLHTEYVIASRQAAIRGQRITMGALGAGLVIALALAVFAFIQRHQAQEQARVARSRELAASALLQEQTNPELSLALAVQAGRTAPTDEAATAIREALDASYARGVLEGHTEAVNSAAFSPDGSRIVTASDDGTVRIWDARSHATIRTLHPSASRVLSAAYDPDGTRIVTAGSRGSVEIWNADTGEKVEELQGHRGTVWSAAWSADGDRIVTAGHDGTARVWNARSGDEVAVFTGHRGNVYDASFSPNGKRVVSASHDGSARVWDAETGREIRVLSVRDEPGVGNTVEVNGADFSPDGRYVVTASDDGVGRVWSTRTGRVKLLLPGSDQMYTAQFSHDGQHVVTANLEAARVWDVATAEELGKGRGFLVVTLRGDTGNFVSAAFTPDDRQVVTANADGTARIWEAGRDDATETFHSGHPAVLSAAFSPDGSRVASAVVYHSLDIWNARTGKKEMAVHVPSLGPAQVVEDAAFSPDGRSVVTADDDGTARILDAQSGRWLVTLRGHAKLANSAAFSPDGGSVVTASNDGTARIWDADTGKTTATLNPHSGPLLSAAFSPDGSRIATAGENGVIWIWDSATHDVLTKLRGHDDAVHTAAWSPDGEHILTASEDGTARIWDAASGKSLLVLRGHQGAVLSSAFSPDGTRVVTGGVDRTARVWDAESGQLLEILRGPRDYVNGVAYGPGDRIAAASYDGDGRIFHCDLCVPFDELLAIAERRAPALTPAEEAQYLGQD